MAVYVKLRTESPPTCTETVLSTQAHFLLLYNYLDINNNKREPRIYCAEERASCKNKCYIQQLLCVGVPSAEVM